LAALVTGGNVRAAFVAVMCTSMLTAQALPTSAGPRQVDCAYRLVPTSAESSTVTPELIGCFTTYEAAVEAGLGGSVDLAPGTTVDQLTDALLAQATGDVLIGTEWNVTNYGGESRSYFASSTCSAAVSWDVNYVSDAWNDWFSSGKGFGGCDRNRKFENSNFGGASVLCTPNCSTYGALSNEVSSLRWRAD
jgi:hypothetical protein